MVLLRQLALDIKRMKWMGRCWWLLSTIETMILILLRHPPRARHGEPGAGGGRCQDHPEKLGIWITNCENHCIIVIGCIFTCDPSKTHSGHICMTEPRYDPQYSTNCQMKVSQLVWKLGHKLWWLWLFLLKFRSCFIIYMIVIWSWLTRL